MHPSFRLVPIVLLCSLCFSSLNAQSGNPTDNGASPLNNQFQLMVDESNRYQRFKVVETNWLNTFGTHLADSLTSHSAAVAGLQETIDDQLETLAEREAEITTLNAEIEELNQEKDGINLLGTRVSKGTYNGVLWTLIAALIAATLFFLGRSRLAAAISKDNRIKNEQLAADLEDARKRRLEVEQDLRRKLQDERNKHSS